MSLIVTCVLTSLLIISISIWIIIDMKRTKKDVEEIKRLRELNLNLDKTIDKILEVTEEKTNRNNKIKKKKTYKQKVEGGFMNKYENKMESLAKQLGESYELSLDYSKKGSINLLVVYLGNVYTIKFNSRKFNEISNATIIKKVKNEILRKIGGNENE